MSSIKENKYCEWRIADIPHGMPIYNTGCGKIRLSCATGIDIYCNACGRKIKIVDDAELKMLSKKLKGAKQNEDFK